MSQFLADVLTNEHPLFMFNLGQLEKAAGNAAVDTRLVADSRERAYTVIRAIGLDPADTHAKELYQALNTLLEDKLTELLSDTSFVLLPFAEGPISFNIQDVIENAHHQLTFDERTYGHAQRHLRSEIVKRYSELERTDTKLVEKLATQVGLIHETDPDYLPLVIEAKSLADTATKPKVLAVGDIFTDAFIELDENYARADTDEDGSKRLSLPFGSKPPYKNVEIVQAVGPSPNAAVSMARLGLTASLMAFLGDDQTGKDSIGYLHSELIATDTVSIQEGIKSNYYYVLRLGAERTILVRNEEYAYDWQEPKEELDWIYLSLISKSSWQLHEDLLRYLDAHPKTKLAFQPGTFHFEWGVDKLREIYKHSHIVVMNREEAVDVTGKSYGSIRDLANGVHDLGPQKVVITDGPNGSYASYDYKLVTIPNYPDPAPPLDRTGAGDAFASTIVAALALGESMDTALTWAPINSMNVVQKLGAQAGLLQKADIEKYLSEAPDWYKLTDLAE